VPNREKESANMSASQRLLVVAQEYCAQRAEHRGNHARKVTGNSAIRQAEAFHRLLPNVVTAL
jgi:4-oxalomesaconate hydratase